MGRTNPYRVLGVSMTADERTIRLAYLALMKRYHPDQNRFDEAAGRARDVAAAYALLSNPDRRAEFDRQRLLAEPRGSATALPPHRPVRGRAAGMLLVVLSGGLVAFAATKPPAQPVRRDQQPVIRPETTAPATPMSTPLPAQPTPSEPPLVLPQQPTTPAPQVAALPLPPPAPPAREAAALSNPTQKSLPDPSAATPSRNACEVAASCPAIDLPALEHHLALLTDQSLQNADPETRALLIRTQTAFQVRVARCASAVCRRDAYLARNREIAEIMRG